MPAASFHNRLAHTQLPSLCTMARNLHKPPSPRKDPGAPPLPQVDIPRKALRVNAKCAPAQVSGMSPRFDVLPCTFAAMPAAMPLRSSPFARHALSIDFVVSPRRYLWQPGELQTRATIPPFPRSAAPVL